MKLRKIRHADGGWIDLYPTSQLKSSWGEHHTDADRPSVFNSPIFHFFHFFMDTLTLFPKQFVASTVADFSFRGERADQHSGDLKVKASRGIRQR